MGKNLLTGVYVIRNLVNGKIYIGSSSISIKERWYRHIASLRRNKHQNKYLQYAWNKYGESNFEFKVLMYCSKETTLENEQKYLDKYKSYDSKIGYNLYRNARSPLGTKKELHVRIAISLTSKKRRPSEETRRLLSEASKRRVRKPHSLESKEKMRISAIRRKFSYKSKNWTHTKSVEEKKEISKKISISLRNRYIIKKSLVQTGKKISKALKGKRISKLQVDRIVSFHTGRKRSEESRAKMSLAQTKRFSSAYNRKAISIAKNKAKRIDPDQVLRKYKTGLFTMTQVGRSFGVSQQTIKKILSQA